jgi:16S rRNA (cytosine967-C5)-methyltransferase
VTPAARIEAVIEVLDGLARTAQPADRFLRDFFRARRYAGSKDRAAIGERVFAIFRHRSAFAWRMQGDTPRALAIASLLAEGVDEEGVAALFAGQGYGPAPLTADERAAIAHAPAGEMPLSVRGEFPPFLEAELTRAFGDALPAEMEAMLARAPIDLRANTLKTTRDALRTALQAEGFAPEDAPFAPDGLRLVSGESAPALRRSPLFESGTFEFQDEAAQIAAVLCDAKPGERVLDLAAGAGGKSLALAAAMRNKGEIVACDIRAGALKELETRAERAGISIIRTRILPDSPTRGVFDAVFVDAPCSGSGTWRRQPELKWRLTSARLAELCAQQDALLAEAASFVKPGGRLLYATCSILPAENEDRVADFLARHPTFAVTDARARWKASAVPPGLARFFNASPRKTATDGFFAAVLVRAE